MKKRLPKLHLVGIAHRVSRVDRNKVVKGVANQRPKRKAKTKENANKEWTFEQARAAADRYIEENGGDDSDLGNPIQSWLHLRFMDGYEKEYSNGDKFALFKAVQQCGLHKTPLPKWVATAISEAFIRVVTYEAQSWDEVFGPIRPKGRHPAAARKEFSYAGVIYHMVQDAKTNNNRAIDDELFNEIGEQFGLKLTQTKKYYSNYKKKNFTVKDKEEISTPRKSKK